jgi:putative membrane protein insertion efficiency factor
MGHCDSPPQFGGHRGFFEVNKRTIAIDSERSGWRRPGSQVKVGMKKNYSGMRALETTVGVRTEIPTYETGVSQPSAIRSPAAGALIGFFRAYQIFLSPILGGACKFYPSCSNYACEAVARHGARQGFLLALKRLGRCRPFTKGGVDLVPEVDELSAQQRGRAMISLAPLHATAFQAGSPQGSTEKEPKQ